MKADIEAKPYFFMISNSNVRDIILQLTQKGFEKSKKTSDEKFYQSIRTGDL